MIWPLSPHTVWVGTRQWCQAMDPPAAEPTAITHASATTRPTSQGGRRASQPPAPVTGNGLAVLLRNACRASALRADTGPTRQWECPRQRLGKRLTGT